MECSICFNAVSKFKVLDCSHFFCEDCTQSLIKAGCKGERSEPTSNGRALKGTKSSGNFENGASSACGEDEVPNGVEEEVKGGEPTSLPQASSNAPSGINCPKCRKVTVASSVAQLRTRWEGSLECRDCDESKSVTEFRWCRPCRASVCSTCYLNRHADGQGPGRQLHESSPWTEFEGVRFLLGQLKRDAANSDDALDKANAYLDDYLNGLREFLYLSLRTRSAAMPKALAEGGRALAEAFGVDWASVAPAKEADKAAAYVLPNLRRLTGMNQEISALTEAREEGEVRLAALPYKELARHLLAPTNSTARFPRLRHLDPERFATKARQGMVIGGSMLRVPVHFARVSQRFVAISDRGVKSREGGGGAGVFVYDMERHLLTGPIPLKTGYHSFGQIAPVPAAVYQGNFGTSTFAVVVKDSKWSLMLVRLSGQGGTEQVKLADGRLHWHLRRDEDASLASSSNLVLLASSTALYRVSFSGGAEPRPEFEPLLSLPPGPAPPVLGPIVDRGEYSEAVLVNGAWGAVDLVKLGRAAEDEPWGLWSISRVELPEGLGAERLSLSLWSGDTTGLEETIVCDSATKSLHRWNARTGESVSLCGWSRKRPLQVEVVQEGPGPEGDSAPSALLLSAAPNHDAFAFEIIHL